MTAADDNASSSKGSGLRLKPPTVPVPAPVASDKTDPKPHLAQAGRKKRSSTATKAVPMWHSTVAAWLVFIVIAASMAAGRYGDVYSWPEAATTYGPYLAIGLHIIIVGMALSDDLFTGFLCLCVPGYSLYWLCARSGRAFYRALVFGLLVGIGEDTWWVLMDWWQQFRTMIDGALTSQR